MSSVKQHRKYNSGYQKCKKKQVKHRDDKSWNIPFIYYLLLLFDFVVPLEPHLSISHWPLIWPGRPCLRSCRQSEKKKRLRNEYLTLNEPNRKFLIMIEWYPMTRSGGCLEDNEMRSRSPKNPLLAKLSETN